MKGVYPEITLSPLTSPTHLRDARLTSEFFVFLRVITIAISANPNRRPRQIVIGNLLKYYRRSIKRRIQIFKHSKTGTWMVNGNGTTRGNRRPTGFLRF